MHDTSAQIREIATKHGLSEASAAQLVTGLLTTGGGQVQFNIPEWGGMGQWMPGMVMAGNLFDHALKARVDTVCADISQQIRGGTLRPTGAPHVSLSWSAPTSWWPSGLGTPTSTGAQDNLRYAWFAATRRLVVNLGGSVTIYDTGDHRIGGVSQQQAEGRMTLTFTSQHGVVDLSALPVVNAPPPDSATGGG